MVKLCFHSNKNLEHFCAACKAGILKLDDGSRTPHYDLMPPSHAADSENIIKNFYCFINLHFCLLNDCNVIQLAEQVRSREDQLRDGKTAVERHTTT